jgi:hypothetical protein
VALRFRCRIGNVDLGGEEVFYSPDELESRFDFYMEFMARRLKQAIREARQAGVKAATDGLPG